MNIARIPRSHQNLTCGGSCAWRRPAARRARPTLTRYEADIYAPVEVYDAEFSGAGGDRIRAWYLRPAGKDLSVHPFTGHVVPTAHVERQLRHLRDFLR